MNNDERYIQNIRDGLLTRVSAARVDAARNMLNLAVLSEEFYRPILNIVLDCNLHNANAVRQGAKGIDLIDEEKSIAMQVSVDYSHEKIKSSIDRFVPPTDGNWQFYFVPLNDKVSLTKNFELPDWLTFDRKKDVLDVARIVELAHYAGIDKLRELSELIDKYNKRQVLCGELRTILCQTRDNHPSFVLLKRDGIDERLFPQAKELKQFEAMGKTEEDGPVSPVWSIIRQSWTSGEKRNIVIEGAGGIGKTVTLFSAANIRDGIIPPAVYVPMHRLVDESGKRVELSDYLGKIHKGINDLVKQEWTDKPQLLVLLDGFNEVPGGKRREILHMINDWHGFNPGAQLIAVSRPMDGMNLKSELSGNPIPITLEPLSRETVREYLGDRTPEESSPVWNVLTRPLFLNLFIRTEGLEGRTSDGYALAPKKAESGGALIWNYLQRELLKIDKEEWVLRCALACEYILPYIACRMEREHRFTIELKQAKELIAEAVKSIDPEKLPCHLNDIFEEYEVRHFDYPDLSKLDWLNAVFNDVGLLKRDKKSYAFIHQNFRDALAGLYLVNQAEMMKSGEPLPEVWQRAANHYVMDYAAELMDELEADRLWEANRIRRPTDSASTYAMLELQRRRFDGSESKLNFSGMDLREISLVRYIKDGESGSRDMKLFRNPKLSLGTHFAEKTFLSPGHTNWVNCVAVTGDGRCVSGSYDTTLRVWDLNTGECLRIMEGHTSSVNCVAVTGDGRCVSGAGNPFSKDHTLRVWDVNAGECLRTMEAHTSSINCVAVTDDGRCISGSSDDTLRVWDMNTGECLRIMEGHTSSVNCVAVTDDGRCISGSNDGTLCVWDLNTGECLRAVEGHTDSITCIAVTDDGRYVTGSSDDTLRVWDLNTGKCLKTLEGHSLSVYCIAVTGDGKCVSGSEYGTLRVWDLNTGECLRTMECHSGAYCVAVTGDSRCVSGTLDGVLLVWDTDTGECLRTIKGHTDRVNCMTVTGDGRCVSGSADGILRVWNLNTRVSFRIMEGHTGEVNCVGVTSDGKCVSGSSDGTLRIWDIRTGVCFRIMRGHAYSVDFVAVTNDVLCISGSMNDDTLRIWDLRTGTCIRTMEGYKVNCAAVTGDGRCVSGSSDNTLLVWDVNTGECLRTLKGHTRPVNCVAVTDNGRCVSGSYDHTLRVWDVNTGESLRTMEEHSNSVSSVAVTGDGRCVSGSGGDRTLRVWDVNTGKCLRTMVGHTSSVNCVAMIDNNKCVSGSDDGTLRIWNINTGKCLNVLYQMELFAGGMDFSCADIPPDLAHKLRQNGAKVPELGNNKINHIGGNEK